jgi:hypothetical protein
MTRKSIVGLFAAACLGAAALLPSTASAHGFHHGWGWGGGYGHHFYGGPAFVVGGGYDDCLQRRIVETRRGPRVRLVNVCGY